MNKDEENPTCDGTHAFPISRVFLFKCMNHDYLSKIVGLVRHANTLRRLSEDLRIEIYLLEREARAMINRHWSYIMLHHSLTKDGATVSWQAIRRYHVETLGWKDIGYHFGIELIGSPSPPPSPARGEGVLGGYEILVGRPLDMEGAHCAAQGMNQKALGICFVGNFDEGPVPAQQWEKGVILVRSLTKLLDIPIPFVVAHRDYAPKSCPGKLLDMDKFRQEVARPVT